jgi:hypothetical protein
MGGSDNPSNLAVVTIEQHALLHKQLWEDLNHWEDKVAWQMLSGQISRQEAIKLAQSEGAKNRKKKFGQENHFYGKKHSDETKARISLSKKGTKPPNKGLVGFNNKQSRMWEITDKQGNKMIIKGLSHFCRENGLAYQSMGQVAKGKFKQHKGYTCKEII